MYLLRLFPILGIKFPRRAQLVVVLCLRKRILQSMYAAVRHARLQKAASTRRATRILHGETHIRPSPPTPPDSQSDRDRTHASCTPRPLFRSQALSWSSKLLDIPEPSGIYLKQDPFLSLHEFFPLNQEPTMDALLLSLRSPPTALASVSALRYDEERSRAAGGGGGNRDEKPEDFRELRGWATRRLVNVGRVRRGMFIPWIERHPSSPALPSTPPSSASSAASPHSPPRSRTRSAASSRSSAGSATPSDPGGREGDLASTMSLLYRAIIMSSPDGSDHDIQSSMRVFHQAMMAAEKEMIPSQANLGGDGRKGEGEQDGDVSDDDSEGRDCGESGGHVLVRASG